MDFFVYTDGSCKGNPGKGGYAYKAYDELGEIWVSGNGSEKETTNNKMELTAAIEAIKNIDKLYENYTIKIFSDSAYMVNCFKDGWIDKWKENGWKTGKKEAVLNKEMWEELYLLVEKTKATFDRVDRKDLRLKEVDKEAKFAAKNLN